MKHLKTPYKRIMTFTWLVIFISFTSINVFSQKILVPDIQVMPDSVSEDLAPGETSMQQLIIKNNGSDPLNWELRVLTEYKDSITFTKPDFADWTQPANQDRITNNVWITRKDVQGIFNIATESGYSYGSPNDTEWAYGLAANLDPDDFEVWVDAVNSFPPGMVGNYISVHLISDDIYLDVMFHSWSGGGPGGGFSYTRPELLEWLNVSMKSGSLAAGDSIPIDLAFNATGLDPDQYRKDIFINSDDPDEPEINVPIIMNVETGIELDLTAFLEGPFDDPEMITSLNPGDLPLSQPYDQSPWNYMGTESVASIPNTGVVDWVLVEVRDTTNAGSATGSTMIARQAAFVLKDGSIAGLDGSSLISFDVMPQYGLFVVIWHRNHLGVISADPLSETGGVYSYDFSSGADQAYGGSLAHVELTPGVWGLLSADGDSDGQVNNADKNVIWNNQAGSSGYLQGDFNMDAQVNNSDKNELWVPNSGSGGQVPDSAITCWIPE